MKGIRASTRDGLAVYISGNQDELVGTVNASGKLSLKCSARSSTPGRRSAGWMVMLFHHFCEYASELLPLQFMCVVSTRRREMYV